MKLGFDSTPLRGFAALDRITLWGISSKGGRAAHRKRRGHEWSSKEAQEAGRKGGQAKAARLRARKVEDVL